jgi:hypothetical protein
LPVYLIVLLNGYYVYFQTSLADLNSQIDPLIADVIGFSGFGNLTREEATFLGNFSNSIFYNPPTPWIDKLPATTVIEDDKLDLQPDMGS